MHSVPLPQLERLFIADAGLETDVIFNRGVDLPCFASITLLQSEEGRRLLREYFQGFISLASRVGTGCLLETASWRASPDWAPKLGLTEQALDGLNRASVELLRDLRDANAGSGTPVLISGCIGPRGDGYDAGEVMTAGEAEAYHLRQARALAAGKPDLLSAITMTNVDEAVGIANAVGSVGLPVVISFTVETDGRLPTGDALGSAVEAVDAATDGYPAYFMINCAHPSHFSEALEAGGEWTGRICGIRANASRCSHAELDAMTELDIGDPQDLAQLYRALRTRMPWLTVLGGCCGTDLRHIAGIASACVPENSPVAAAAG